MTAVNELTVGFVGGGFQATANTITSFTLDSLASLDAIAWCFQMPKADTITHLGFYYTSKSGAAVDHRISLQALDASGNPTGTPLGGGTPASATITGATIDGWSAGTWQWIAITNYVAARGDIFAIVLEPTATPSFNIQVASRHLMQSGLFGIPFVQTKTDGAAWIKTAASTWPIFGAKSATRSYGHPFSSLFLTAIGTNGHRQALKFKIPGTGTYKVAGIRWVGQVGGDTVNHLVGLWNAAGTVLQKAPLDSAIAGRQSNSGGIFENYFTQDASGNPLTNLVALDLGTYYYAGIERVDYTANHLAGITVANAADLSAYPGGTDFALATWNGSAWEDAPTTRPFVELLLEDLTTSTGGSLVVKRRRLYV